MTETYAESETEASRGNEKSQELRTNTDSNQNARRPSEGIGNQCLASDRENRTEGIGVASAIGGILDQLINDAEKQLVRSRECIVWYREEAKEYEQKLNNLRKLKELQQQTAAEPSNSDGENLAE